MSHQRACCCANYPFWGYCIFGIDVWLNIGQGLAWGFDRVASCGGEIYSDGPEEPYKFTVFSGLLSKSAVIEAIENNQAIPTVTIGGYTQPGVYHRVGVQNGLPVAAVYGPGPLNSFYIVHTLRAMSYLYGRGTPQVKCYQDIATCICNPDSCDGYFSADGSCDYNCNPPVPPLPGTSKTRRCDWGDIEDAMAAGEINTRFDYYFSQRIYLRTTTPADPLNTANWAVGATVYTLDGAPSVTDNRTGNCVDSILLFNECNDFWYTKRYGSTIGSPTRSAALDSVGDFEFSQRYLGNSVYEETYSECPDYHFWQPGCQTERFNSLAEYTNYLKIGPDTFIVPLP
jgi:hypothetical protein